MVTLCGKEGVAPEGMMLPYEKVCREDMTCNEMNAIIVGLKMELLSSAGVTVSVSFYYVYIHIYSSPMAP